ncbi:MAG: hypothetical protein ACR2HN_02565 [Tepidiformaceae bacterium]
MVQVRISVANLPAEIGRVLAWLAAGDEVLLEHEGAVVAALVPPGAPPPEGTPELGPAPLALAEVERLLHDPALTAAWEEMELEEAMLQGLEGLATPGDE